MYIVVNKLHEIYHKRDSTVSSLVSHMSNGKQKVLPLPTYPIGGGALVSLGQSPTTDLFPRYTFFSKGIVLTIISDAL